MPASARNNGFALMSACLVGVFVFSASSALGKDPNAPAGMEKRAARLAILLLAIVVGHPIPSRAEPTAFERRIDELLEELVAAIDDLHALVLHVAECAETGQPEFTGRVDNRVGRLAGSGWSDLVAGVGVVARQVAERSGHIIE